jgi:hypothetical protein
MENTMKQIIQSMKIGLLVVGLAVFATTASAQTAAQPMENGQSLKSMVAQSDLVFSGSVVNIEYALSKPTGPNEVALPHTFVTYSVEEVFAGESPGGFVTLRFIGGLDLETMRILSTSQTPQFDLGDEDILFVQDNTKKLCPLVGNIKGRLRVIKEQIYSEKGQSILLEKNGQLKEGGSYSLDEVDTTTIEGHTFTNELKGSKRKILPSNAVEVTRLKSLLKQSAKGYKPKKAFANADPSSSFAAPSGTPAAPPKDQADQK